MSLREAGPAAPDPAALAQDIRRQGFVCLPAAPAQGFFGLQAGAWRDFAATWDDLPQDDYMADGGRYRQRRHACYTGAAGTPLARAAARPHYQALRHNPLNGGIARWFAPVLPPAGPVMAALLAGAQRVFEAVSPPPAAGWLAEVHQFRTLALAGAEGRPTPEGMHRDGVAFVLVLLVGRHNVGGGRTDIRIDGRDEPASFTLEQPMDAVLLDDARVWHGVTPVLPLAAGGTAYRDALVLTFAPLQETTP